MYLISQISLVAAICVAFATSLPALDNPALPTPAISDTSLLPEHQDESQLVDPSDRSARSIGFVGVGVGLPGLFFISEVIH